MAAVQNTEARVSRTTTVKGKGNCHLQFPKPARMSLNLQYVPGIVKNNVGLLISFESGVRSI